MGFKLKTKPKYPCRQWALCGFPGDGKSTFATQMKTPILPIDADHRFDQVMHLVEGGEVLEFGKPADHVLVSRIVDTLYCEMPEEAPHIGTIVVDSLTQIIVPIIMQGMAENAAKKQELKTKPKLTRKTNDEEGEGEGYSFASAFIGKAVAMKQLRTAVTAWGTDVLWIYHLQEGKNHKGKDTITTSIPKLEIARMMHTLNAKLRVVTDEKSQKRGIFVEWSRGRDGMTLWDASGCWLGMPEKLEAAMYDGLSEEELARKKPPTGFKGPDQAIAWAVEYGAYATLTEGKDAYNSLRETGNPPTAPAMWELWIAHVMSGKEQADA